MSRIEQIIAELEEYVDNCKFQPLSSSKIVANKDELLELIEDLKHCIPDEIKKYQRIIANRDAILKDAQDKAEEMIKKANEMTAQLVSEHEIMNQAMKEANNVIENATKEGDAILDKATMEANEVKLAAVQYTDDSLAMIQHILSASLDGLNVKYEELVNSLQTQLDVTTKNRNQLNPPAAQAAPMYQDSSYAGPETTPIYGNYDEQLLEDVVDYPEAEYDEEIDEITEQN